jgi:hypothetical protein
MKRVGIILMVLLVVLQLCSSNIWARPTTQQEAEKVVKAWLKASPQPLGTALGRQVTNIETYTDDGGNPLYYIVYLQPNGFVIVSADDLIEPIIGFAEDGIYDPSPTNPLGALVTGDLNSRIKSVRTTSQPVRTKTVTGVSAEPQDKWSKLIGLAETPAKEYGTLGLPNIDDVRVPPLVQTRWSQTTCCSSPKLACYNYYTPGPPNETNVPGDANNYWCGCVATALAQIMRYHQYPTTGIGKYRFDILIWGGLYHRWTQGGDGAGGAYDWANMVLVPGCSTTLAQRKAIGALCYDAGVAISNRISGEYTYYDHDGIETVAYTHSAKLGLTSTSNGFKYGNAIYGYNGGFNIGDGLIGMVNPDLDAGKPVYFGIRKGASVGHAVVCDGYGYNAGTMYHHINMGWAGTSDAWYDLPDITSSYNTITETIYNICPTLQGNREMISGRVTNPAGNPISDVMVYADYPAGGFTYISNTNTKGIYAFDSLNSNATLYVGAMKTGYVFGGEQQVQTGQSSDSQPASGNLWGIDIVCIPPDINTMTPTSGPWGTYMKIQGTHFGSSPGEVIFTGGYYGEILQWSDTLILCRDYCPYSGDVIVRSSVGVDSEGVHFEATNPTTIYVDVNHTPDVENGSTIYPFSKIERGTYAATYADTVIVKPGTYNENVNFTSDWGGITLTGTDPNDFNTVASTIIDGGGNGTVVTFDYDCSVLTGFTITNGYTDGYGGGIRCNGQWEEAPTISHCIITGNSAGIAGGGISCSDSSPTIDNCIITGNRAYDWFGGGIDCNNTEVWYSPTISNCLIAGNWAQGGGGICSMGNITINHCNISSNIAEGGGGILCAGGNMTVHHTILWADTAPYGPEIAMVNFGDLPPVLTIAYSDVQGGLMGVYQTGGSLYWDANNIIDADPIFVNDPNPGPDGLWDDVNDNFGDLHLSVDSPCIDAGDPNYVPGPNETDIDGQPRIVGSHIDIGADEFVYPGDIEPDGDVDIADLAIFANYWQDTNCGKCGGADFTGDGKVDFDDLSILTDNWLAGTGP